VLGQGKSEISGVGRNTSQFGELVLKLPMHITAMLVLLHGPDEQRLSAALFFPSFQDVRTRV
jgi:hypothetical protein